MRSRLSKIGLVIVCLCLAAFPVRGARDLTTAPDAVSDYQLIVLEVAHCIYCQLFRRDVLPTYEASARSKSVPMRFVDINHGSLAAFQLTAPVETVPTVVLLRQRREVGRLTGHVGPEIFLHALNRLISTAP